MKHFLFLFINILIISATTITYANTANGLITQEYQFINLGARSGEGYFSRDSSKIIYQSEKINSNPFYQIYLRDLKTNTEQLVSMGIGKTTCGFIHPSNTKVMFSSTHLDPEAINKQNAEIKKRKIGKKERYSWDYDTTYDIFERDLKTNKVTNLTHAVGYNAEGSYSPDGTKILFASNLHAYNTKLNKEEQKIFDQNPSGLMDLYLMNSDGSGRIRLTTALGYDGGPFFNKTGTKITWRRFDISGRFAEIMVMDINLITGKTSNIKTLTNTKVISWAPYFHPSDKYIIYSTNLAGRGNFELYIVDTQGDHSPVRVTHFSKFDGLPVFELNGNFISWSSERSSNGKSQIFMGNWNHKKALELLGL